MEGEAEAVDRARKAEALVGRAQAGSAAGAAHEPAGPGAAEPGSLWAGPRAPATQPQPGAPLSGPCKMLLACGSSHGMENAECR